MQLQLQNFQTLVSNAAAAVQGAARQLLDLTVGSTLRAVLEANAAIGLWMQWLILQVLSMTRAATSQGADLDSFVADFTMARLPASPAAGQASFSRFTPTQSALIPPGITLRTADGSQSFVVTTNPSHSAWSAPLAGYVLGAGIQTVTLPIQAQTEGAAGNVQAASISLISAAIPGVDTVTNPAPLAGGLDAESDDALRTRFGSFLASRSRATPLAVGHAILSTRQGLSYTLQENQTPDGTYRPGSFVLTVDDGSGTPSISLLTNVASAVETIRPLGSLYTVQAPTLVTANVSLSITTQPGANHVTIAAACVQSLTAAINQLAIGQPLPATRIAQIAYGTDPAVTNVQSILLNAASADIVPSPSGLIRAGLIQVN